jgi:radical SAM protein with 4Fe4S-binding SPASM domain
VNIFFLQKIKKKIGVVKPLVRIQTVLIPELRGKEEEYAAFWSPKVDEVAYLDMKDEEMNPDHRGLCDDWACHMLWQRMTIAWDGTILPCVHDIYEWMKFGNISETSIREAWNSIQEHQYREIHKLGKAHTIPSCDRCPLRASEISKIRLV